MRRPCDLDSSKCPLHDGARHNLRSDFSMQLFVALAAAAYAPALHPNHSPTRLAVSRHSFLTMQEDEPAEAAPPPPPPPPPPPAFIPGETCTGEKVAVVGATGYIGKAVVREAVRRGYQTTAVVRDPAAAAAEPKFAGANVVQADVTVPSTLTGPLGSADVVISCLASRSGSKKDSFAIDYQATLNCLEAAKAAGARHFVMLSAFCVKSAEIGDEYALQFQYAKKDMEAALRSQSDVSYTIVRPTAFFKSVSGQVEVVDGGGPFVYFDLGGGKCATCNPIAEADLAAALVDTIGDKTKENMLWNLGGPDEGLSMKQQVCSVQQQHTLFHSFFAALAHLSSHHHHLRASSSRRCLARSRPLSSACRLASSTSSSTASSGRPTRQRRAYRLWARRRSFRRSSTTRPSSGGLADTMRSSTCSRPTRAKSTGRRR